MMSIALPKELLFVDTPMWLDSWQKQQKLNWCETIDAQDLQKFDSSAIAMLLQCRRDALAAQQPLQLLNVPVRLQNLMQLYGVASYF